MTTQKTLIPKLEQKQILIGMGLIAIILLGGFLRFYRLGEDSIGNGYYAATVQSMLTSWHNFFFASFEPGGSVTVDKPPLGFWVQAISAYFLGVNGFALAFPQALAGLLSIPLLYLLVKRHFGPGAGLIAALVLATTPVTISTERNNTIDGLLLFVLLLATWAFFEAVRSGRLRHLLLGAFLIGLGFNIKMLQAFMPLPALYALYWWGTSYSWRKKIIYLGSATALLIAVSLSWAIIVDLVPEENRPFIGSSTNNSVTELIVGHNGLKRLGLYGGPGPGPNNNPPNDGGPPGQFGPPPPPMASIDGSQGGQFPPNNPLPPPDGGQRGQFFPGNGPPPRGPGGPGGEVGSPGPLRLFTLPLAIEAGWLLPLALFSIPIVWLTLGRNRSWNEKHVALAFWSIWLLSEMAYFSITSGLFHAYYLIMLGPPMAALIGAGGWAIWHQFKQQSRWAWSFLISATVITLAVQMMTLGSYGGYLWLAVPTGILLLTGLSFLIARTSAGARKTGLTFILVALVFIPLSWATLTIFNNNTDVWLPRSGPGGGRMPPPSGISVQEAQITEYLVAHTEPDDYLLATLDAREASPFILATKRPVLTFGGFNGGDNVIDAEQLAQMVAEDNLRFVYAKRDLDRRKPEIAQWLNDHCTTISISEIVSAEKIEQNHLVAQPPRQESILYDCQ